MSSRKIPVLAFEDAVMIGQTGIFSQLQQDMGVTEGGEYEFYWHAKWNCLGDVVANKYGIETRQIIDAKVYQEAIGFSQTQDLKEAIIFIDCNFPAVKYELCRHADSGFSSFLENEMTFAVKEAGNVSSFVNAQKQGVPLMYYFIKNDKVRDVDIWLASDMIQTNSLASVLQTVADSEGRGVRVFDASGAITKPDVGRIVTRLRNAFSTFRGRFDGSELFWPDECSNWFLDNEEGTLIKHDFGVIPERDRQGYKKEISHYLEKVTGRKSFPDRWFADKGLHETLKNFVGFCSKLQAGEGSYLPSLGIIALVAASIEGQNQEYLGSPDDWLQQFTFSHTALAPILAGDRDHARQAILSMRRFFGKLFEARSGKASYIASAEWKTYGTGGTKSDHLCLTFRSDCLTPGCGKSFSSIEKLTNVAWYSGSGLVTRDYIKFRELFSKDKKQTLVVSIYPIGSKHDVTVFDFRAV